MADTVSPSFHPGARVYPDGNAIILSGRQSGDTFDRFRIDSSGRILRSDGTFAPAMRAYGEQFVPWTVGQWYCSPLCYQTRTLVPTTSELRLVPFYSGPDGVTIDKLDVCTTVVGSAGSVARLGIWKIDNQTRPFAWAAGTQWATLLTDAGTVATDSGTGSKPITLGTAQVIPAETWFAIGAAHQVATAATTQVAGQSGGLWYSPLGNTGAGGYLTSAGLTLVQTSVTGAFGATFTPTGIGNADGGCGLHRSA